MYEIWIKNLDLILFKLLINLFIFYIYIYIISYLIFKVIHNKLSYQYNNKMLLNNIWFY